MIADCHHRRALIDVDRVIIFAHQCWRWSSLCDRSRCRFHRFVRPECSEIVSKLLSRNRLPVSIPAQPGYIFISEWSFNLFDFVTLCSRFSLRDFRFRVQVWPLKWSEKFSEWSSKDAHRFKIRKSFLQSSSRFSASVSLIFISECSHYSPIRVHKTFDESGRHVNESTTRLEFFS